LSAPHPGSPVEIEVPARAVYDHLLDDEMAVEHYRLDLCQQTVVAVDVTPSHLHHAQTIVGEVVDHLQQTVGTGYEVRIEDRYELPFGQFQPRFQRACFEALPVLPVVIGAVEPFRS